MNADELNVYYREMDACKEYVDSLQHNKNEANEKTKNEYIRDYLRMQNKGTDPLSQSISTKTYYKYRAAWVYSNLILYEEIYRLAYYEENIIKKISLISQLIECVGRLKLFPPDPNGLNFIAAKEKEYVSPWNSKAAPPSKTKKHQKLPKDWSIKYFNHILSKGSKYTDAIAIMSLIGCRPSELEGGITLKLNDDMSFKIHIDSKKTKNGVYGHGQEFREFNVKEDTVEYSYLLKKLQKNGQIIIKIDTAKALGEQMRKYSKIVFPRLFDYVSPYTYRHHFSQKIKTVLDNKTDIAIALGHSSSQSMRYYSNKKNKGSRGFYISEIEGTRDVKTYNNVEYKAIFFEKGKQSGACMR